jgi:hypothetical protein
MSDPTRPYEPLTSENAALVLVDHQVGLMSGVRDYSTGELKHNVVALAKSAKALKLPIVVTTTARDSMWGPTFPELVEALPGVPIIDRSSVNAFDDPKVAQAMIATSRKEADLRRHLPRSLRGFPRHHRHWHGPRRLCGCRRLRNFQRDQTTGRPSAHAAGRRDPLRLRHADGGNQGQRATRGCGRLRRDGHALGQARRANRAGVRQTSHAPVRFGAPWPYGRMLIKRGAHRDRSCRKCSRILATAPRCSWTSGSHRREHPRTIALRDIWFQATPEFDAALAAHFRADYDRAAAGV